ncbi:malate synthase G [Polycladidibacter stylochi]|uniref:malate synthase G n=1 Tax=Polycladidibacter stylochi TaxID=1807766 RepID=UPI0008350B81|nr:malate synthase G [Pseudovibrio stylochi]
MKTSVTVAGMQIDANFHDFVESRLLKNAQIKSDFFWQSLNEIHRDLSPINRQLLEKRSELQGQLDAFYQQNTSPTPQDQAEFLNEIGYLSPNGGDFTIDPANVDPEIARSAAPQLVVPVTNARYLLNAANARWGSLYDALYGSDALGSLPPKGDYDSERGKAVITYCRNLLDTHIPLDNGSWHDVTELSVFGASLALMQGDEQMAGLENTLQFVGYFGNTENPDRILLEKNGLHIELVIDRKHTIGRIDLAGIADIQIESALTTIVDFEDSVAVVDANEKLQAYANWLGVMDGTLQAEFEKTGKTIKRSLAQDRHYIDAQGEPLVISGRSLLLVRNMGITSTTPLVRDENGEEYYEGILDAVITSLIALQNQHSDGLGKTQKSNSQGQSIYIVKPKLHGADEVVFVDTLFDRVEKMLSLATGTIKLGLMDEERRTSLNLKECIRAAKDRICFINTGFLDRTGDEIHSAMQFGPLVAKDKMRHEKWYQAYEENNVRVGLETGFSGVAQIGKGMWPKPDSMKAMLQEKQAQVLAGASTAWVPSPTAATLHALHYLEHNTKAIQESLEKDQGKSTQYDLITLPVISDRPTPEEIETELFRNAQSILGYVVRWVDQGIGCSKIPDLDGTGLMEDRATLRISAQSLANWLLHGLCTQDQIEAAFLQAAHLVDQQNIDEVNYSPIASNPQSNVAYQTALKLVLNGAQSANDYTESELFAGRRQRKQQLQSVT